MNTRFVVLSWSAYEYLTSKGAAERARDARRIEGTESAEYRFWVSRLRELAAAFRALKIERA